MERADDWGDDPLSGLINDHEEVSEYLEQLKRVMELAADEEAWRDLEPVERFFATNLVMHFELEEECIFEPLLLKRPTRDNIQLVLDLQKEHGMILKELERFEKVALADPVPPDEETAASLRYIGTNIMESLLLHASKEDDHLIPLLQKDPSILG